MKIKGIFFVSFMTLSTISGAYAQDSLQHLQDLIGARGRDGEYQMEKRGYHWMRTAKSNGDAYSYWRDNRSGRCVSVCTSQGRYISIVDTPDFDCQVGKQGGGSGGDSEQGDKFSTVCGVAVNDQLYSYRCEAVDVYQGNRLIHTVLHYPDQTLKLLWHGPNSATVRMQGLYDQEIRYSSSEGETRFRISDKTYFYISNKEAASREVQGFGK